jgi:hypothetical protein
MSFYTELRVACVCVKGSMLLLLVGLVGLWYHHGDNSSLGIIT